MEISFGQFLRQTRKEQRVSLRTVAKVLGVTPGYLSFVERGVVPPPPMDRIIEIARVMDIDPGFLLVLGMTERGTIEIPLTEDLERNEVICDFVRLLVKGDRLSVDDIRKFGGSLVNLLPPKNRPQNNQLQSEPLTKVKDKKNQAA